MNLKEQYSYGILNDVVVNYTSNNKTFKKQRLIKNTYSTMNRCLLKKNKD